MTCTISTQFSCLGWTFMHWFFNCFVRLLSLVWVSLFKQDLWKFAWLTIKACWRSASFERNPGISICKLWLPSSTLESDSYPVPLSLCLLCAGYLIYPPASVWQRQHSDQFISSEFMAPWITQWHSSTPTLLTWMLYFLTLNLNDDIFRTPKGQLSQSEFQQELAQAIQTRRKASAWSYGFVLIRGVLINHKGCVPYQDLIIIH